MNHPAGNFPAEPTLRAFAQTIPHLAWMAHVDGSIAWFNNRWYEFTGTSADELTEESWRELVHPDDVDRVLAGYRRAIADRRQWEDTFRLRSAGGGYRWFLTRMVLVRDSK